MVRTILLLTYRHRRRTAGYRWRRETDAILASHGQEAGTLPLATWPQGLPESWTAAPGCPSGELEKVIRVRFNQTTHTQKNHYISKYRLNI